MTRDYYKPSILLPSLALPATALSYWRSGDQMPMRMAVHFLNLNSQPVHSELVGPTSPALRDSGDTAFLSRHS